TDRRYRNRTKVKACVIEPHFHIFNLGTDADGYLRRQLIRERWVGIDREDFRGDGDGRARPGDIVRLGYEAEWRIESYARKETIIDLIGGVGRWHHIVCADVRAVRGKRRALNEKTARRGHV